MIFVTVGTQEGFDRLVRTVDEWAGERQRRDVFAQIHESEYTPVNIEWAPFIEPPEFKRRAAEADFLVAHAGMGSIITALQFGKPILVMPKRGDLRETRNDHQIATAKRFGEMGKVAVAMDESELRLKLDELDALRGDTPISPWASESLLEAVRGFVNG